MVKPLDVLAVGNAIVDVLARVDDDFLNRHDIAKGRMALIDDDRAVSLYDALPPAVEISGGSAANTAAGVASLGGAARFVGKVADDQLGAVFTHDLRAAGVAFDAAPLENGSPTARSMIAVTPDGERSMSTFIGAAAHVGESDIREEDLVDVAWVFLEGYLFNAPATKKAFDRAAELARAKGAKTAITLSDVFCVEGHRADFDAFIDRRADLVLANEAEAKALAQTDDFDQAVDALRGRAETVVITRSEKGCVIAAEAMVKSVPAQKVDHVADATGAGDLFAAGLFFGLARGLGAETGARLGALAAAEVISHIGARPETSLKALAQEAGLL